MRRDRQLGRPASAAGECSRFQRARARWRHRPVGYYVATTVVFPVPCGSLASAIARSTGSTGSPLASALSTLSFAAATSAADTRMRAWRDESPGTRSSTIRSGHCSAGTTSGSSNTPAKPAAGTTCAMNTDEPRASCCLPSRMRSPGAGPRAATGDDASNPLSATSETSDPGPDKREARAPRSSGRVSGSLPEAQRDRLNPV